jgi:glycosyltransferase involved in cell wall biosynthesis
MARVPHVVSGIRVAERRSRFRLWLDRSTDRWVTRHVCVSEAVAKFSIEQGGLPADKVVVIPNGVDGERFQTATAADLSQFGIPPGTPVVLSVGRLDPQKAPLDLLAALRMLAKRRDDFHALFVGDGPLLGELQSAIAASALNGRVHLLGRRDDVPELMQAASCLALPSLWEGMPNVVLEAMAAGLPVVATEVEGSTELLRPGGESGDFGLLVPPNSPEGMSAALDRVLNTSEEVTAMALASQHHVIEHFTWDSVTKSCCQLYHSLLNQTAR